jgi:type II secretory pathway component PulJ
MNKQLNEIRKTMQDMKREMTQALYAHMNNKTIKKEDNARHEKGIKIKAEKNQIGVLEMKSSLSQTKIQ